MIAPAELDKEPNNNISTHTKPPSTLASKPTKPSSIRTTSAISVNLNDIVSKATDDEKVLQESKGQQEETYGHEPFTFEAVKKLWEEFADQKKAAGRDSEYAVLKQELMLKDEQILVLRLTNAVKINILEKFRSDLMTFLKSGLNNGNVQLETELVVEENKKMIYTNREKFDYLAEKKPILNELKDRLGLDPDF